MVSEEIRELDAKLQELHITIGRLEMWKQIAELMIPIRHQLPPAFVAAVLRAHPNAKT